MVRLRTKRLSVGSIKKIYVRNIGPYTIKHKISNNTYIVDLYEDLGINASFNMEDISLYYRPLSFDAIVIVSPLIARPTPQGPTIDSILEDQIFLHLDEQEHRFSVR